MNGKTHEKVQPPILFGTRCSLGRSDSRSLASTLSAQLRAVLVRLLYLLFLRRTRAASPSASRAHEPAKTITKTMRTRVRKRRRSETVLPLTTAEKMPRSLYRTRTQINIKRICISVYCFITSSRLCRAYVRLAAGANSFPLPSPPSRARS